jgi:hypothetical protein
MSQLRPCHERRHMNPAEFGLWTYALTVSWSSGIFYAGLRSTAEQFGNTNKNVIARIVQSLEKKGWLEKINTPGRDGDGNYLCKQYRVLTHDRWVKKHPGTCPDSGTGKHSSLAPVPVPVPQPVPSPVPPPVPNPGSSIERKYLKERLETPSFEAKKRDRTKTPAQAAKKNPSSPERDRLIQKIVGKPRKNAPLPQVPFSEIRDRYADVSLEQLREWATFRRQ